MILHPVCCDRMAMCQNCYDGPFYLFCLAEFMVCSTCYVVMSQFDEQELSLNYHYLRNEQ